MEYLKNSKKIGILCNEDTGWRASIHCGSVMFSTPITACTCSRTSRHNIANFVIIFFTCILIVIGVPLVFAFGYWVSPAAMLQIIVEKNL